MYRNVTAPLICVALTVYALVAFELALAGPATAATAAAPSGYWVSEYAMDAKLRAKYNYAFCTGLRKYGTQALNTNQYGWVPGYFVFECSYDTDTLQCFNAHFESMAGARRGQWWPRMLSRGRCYSR